MILVKKKLSHRRRKGRDWSPAQRAARARRQVNDRAYRRRKLADGYLWEATGGGTWIGPALKGKFKNLPSDVSFENLKTGEIAIVRCTTEMYFGPMRKHRWLRRLSEVTRIKGVVLESRRTRKQIDADVARVMGTMRRARAKRVKAGSKKRNAVRR